MEPAWAGLVTALGLGLLIGIERERHKIESNHHLAAGARTFTLISLVGALTAIVGTPTVVAGALFVGLAALVSYRSSQATDPGLTTEIAMFATFLLGVLSMSNALLAASLSAGVALILAAKTRLHGFIRQTLSEQELHDGLLLLGMVLIVLPLLPDRALDPWGVFNLQKLGRLMVLVMTINALGYIGQRALGSRLGLPISGFAGGFISATATIAAMGTHSRTHSNERAGALAAALLANIATILQIAIVLGLLAPALLNALKYALLLSGFTAAIIGSLAGWHAWRKQDDDLFNRNRGRAFDLRSALIFVCVIVIILLASALLSNRFGQEGAILAAGLAGFADAHAPTASMAQISNAGNIDRYHAMLAIGLALATNSVSKVIVAFLNGGRSFGIWILGGMLVIVSAFGLGIWISR